MWLDFTQGKPDLDRLEKDFPKNWQQSILSFLRQWYDGQSTVSVRSSGTTGGRQTFFIKKAHMAHSARMTADFFGLKPGSQALLCLSPDYIAAKMLLVRSAALGWRLCCMSPSSRPLRGVDVVFDFVPMVPLQAIKSLTDLSKTKILLIGGASVPWALEEALQGHSTACYASYGMTETLSHVALRRINGVGRERYFSVLPGVELSLDGRGCMRIFAPQLMDAPLQTRDLVELVSESEFAWLGRHDHLINSGGVKVIPERWEERLRTFIRQPFFITALPDDLLGQKAVLIVEGQPISLEIPEGIFINGDRFCKPREIYFIPHFLRTSSGKIRRKETLQKFIENKLLKIGLEDSASKRSEILRY